MTSDAKVEILSDAINCPVIKMPGRKFPGIVLQGDSLMALFSLTEEIEEFTVSLKSDELNAVVGSLRERLGAYRKEYEKTMKARGLQLPYVE